MGLLDNAAYILYKQNMKPPQLVLNNDFWKYQQTEAIFFVTVVSVIEWMYLKTLSYGKLPSVVSAS